MTQVQTVLLFDGSRSRNKVLSDGHGDSSPGRSLAVCSALLGVEDPTTVPLRVRPPAVGAALGAALCQYGNLPTPALSRDVRAAARQLASRGAWMPAAKRSSVPATPKIARPHPFVERKLELGRASPFTLQKPDACGCGSRGKCNGHPNHTIHLV